MKFRLMKKRFLHAILSLMLGTVVLSGQSVYAAGEMTIFTPYTSISVAPGESIDYDLTILNNSSSVQTTGLSVSGLPSEWEASFSAGGWNIDEVSVLPYEQSSVHLDIEVPLKVNKGTYNFNVVAGSMDTLPLSVTVSEQGTYETELTLDQANMEGHADATFTFDADLRNRTAETQVYSLQAQTPSGWQTSFKYGGNQVTSVEVEPNQTASITIVVNPPDQIAADTYTIPITASSGSSSAQSELEVVITGSYGMELTTKNEVLSTEVTVGDAKTLQMVVKNTGTSPLTDVTLDYAAPTDWEVTYSPKTIDEIAPGESATVEAKIQTSDQSIAGDYVTRLTASTSEVTANSEIRVTVQTSLLWGWIGILIIAAALGGVYYLFRKYGRR